MTNLPKELTNAHDAYIAAQLLDADREHIRAALAGHMRIAAVRKSMFERLFTGAERLMPSLHYSSIRKPMPILAFLIAATVLGGGTSYAAAGSLPGDFLYPVKIHVNEAVQEALAVTPASRASVEAALAATRLHEAQQLAAEGKLSTTTAAALETNLTAHLNQASSSIAALAKSDPSAAADENSSLAARIIANEDVLSALTGEGSTTRRANMVGMVASMTAHLAAIQRQGDEIRADFASSTATTTTAHVLAGIADRAKAQLDDATHVVAQMDQQLASSTATSSTIALQFAQQAKDALNRATSEYTTASSTRAAGHTTAAMTGFYASLAVSEQARSYARAALRFSKVQMLPKRENTFKHEGKHAFTASSTFPGAAAWAALHGRDGEKNQHAFTNASSTASSTPQHTFGWRRHDDATNGTAYGSGFSHHKDK